MSSGCSPASSDASSAHCCSPATEGDRTLDSTKHNARLVLREVQRVVCRLRQLQRAAAAATRPALLRGEKAPSPSLPPPPSLSPHLEE
eukprot:scaffold123703_cov31-Tisochrysis_lutea.AAC.2